MCVCLTINARKKFRIKNLHTRLKKTDGYAAMFCCNVGADIFVGITIYRSHKKVVSAGPWKHPKPPHNVLAPEVNSSRVNSHSPVSPRPLCKLVPESTRPRVNSSLGQLEHGSTRPRVNSSPSQLAPGQLFPESTRPRVTLRPRVNSSPSQLAPESTRPLVNSSPGQLAIAPVPGQLAPTSTRTRVIPPPSQLAPRSTRTQVPAYHTTHLPIYLHYLRPT